MVCAALKTKAEIARQTVLEMMNASTDGQTRGLLINALRLSPGDKKWLTRASVAISAIEQTAPDNAELARQVKLATEWLNSRLKNEQEQQ
jgi:hypothetical protein